MTYIITTNTAAADFETYRKVFDRVQAHAHGRIAHYAGMNKTGLAITTVWESKAHSDRFATQHLEPAIHDIAGDANEPGILVGFEATDALYPAANTGHRNARRRSGWRKQMIRWSFGGALLCIGALTSCSDETSPDETANAEPPGSPSVLSPVVTAPASSTTTTPPTSSVPPAGVVTDEIDILPSVDWLEVDEHGVWAKLEPALVYLIDPTTNEVSDQIKVGGEPCQGLGVGDGSVWACAGTDVVRIDPTTNEVVATFAINKTYSQGELAVSAGTTWVLTGGGTSLLPIDTATNTPGTPITLPARGTDLGAGPSGAWVISNLDQVVIHLDPETGAVLSSTELIGPTDIAVDDDEVWVVAPTETLRIDPATGAIDLTVPVGGGRYGSIALTDDTVWLRTTDTFLTRINRATGQVIDDENTAVYTAIADRLTSNGDIVTGFGSIWTSAYDDAKLFRISTGEPAP